MLSRLLKEHQIKQNERKELQGKDSYIVAVKLTEAKNKANLLVKVSFPVVIGKGIRNTTLAFNRMSFYLMF